LCPINVTLTSLLKQDMSQPFFGFAHRHSEMLNGASLGGYQNLNPQPGHFSLASLGNDHRKKQFIATMCGAQPVISWWTDTIIFIVFLKQNKVL
jgi:hypothetical protein